MHFFKVYVYWTPNPKNAGFLNLKAVMNKHLIPILDYNRWALHPLRLKLLKTFYIPKLFYASGVLFLSPAANGVNMVLKE